MAELLAPDAVCFGHLDRRAVAVCDQCGHPFCRECRVEAVEDEKDVSRFLWSLVLA